jgi:hypothetical protein
MRVTKLNEDNDKNAYPSQILFILRTMNSTHDRDGVLFDTALLIVGRAGYALACRRFLHSILNPTLRELSADEVVTKSAIPVTDIYSDTDDDASRTASPLTSSIELPPLPSHRPQHVLKLNHPKDSGREHVKTGARALSRIAR